jgi:DNA-binding transcriptional MerR regulator
VEYSIQDVARATGITSRTLRHYDQIGLLPADRGRNGYRTYSESDLVRLQRILLLREAGLALPAIASVLQGQADDAAALRRHLHDLRHEANRLARQIASVQQTIDRIETKEPLMAERMFDGFDNSQYREEVEQRWGRQAWESGDTWWRGLSDQDKAGFTQKHLDIAADWQTAREAGLPIDSPQVQQIAARHAEWIAIGWQGKRPDAEALTGLAEMYIADERFAANYGGVEGAQYVRDGLITYALTLLD